MVDLMFIISFIKINYLWNNKVLMCKLQPLNWNSHNLSMPQLNLSAKIDLEF